MEAYRLAYYDLSTKVNEARELLMKPLEGENLAEIRNSGAARTLQAAVLLDEAWRRAQRMLGPAEGAYPAENRAAQPPA